MIILIISSSEWLWNLQIRISLIQIRISINFLLSNDCSNQWYTLCIFNHWQEFLFILLLRFPLCNILLNSLGIWIHFHFYFFLLFNWNFQMTKSLPFSEIFYELIDHIFHSLINHYFLKYTSFCVCLWTTSLKQLGLKLSQGESLDNIHLSSC